MYSIKKLLGGGESWGSAPIECNEDWWYLVAPCGRVVDAAHEDVKEDVEWLCRVANVLNNTLVLG